MNMNELHRLQSEQLLIMKQFIKICNEHDIKYFMAYGSLLGTVRHGGTIPWDYDIDLFMKREDFLLLTDFISEMPNNIIIKPMYTENYDKVSLVRLYKKETRIFHKNHNGKGRIDGIHIDIFIIDYAREYPKFLKNVLLLPLCKYLSLCQIDKFERVWLYDRFKNNILKKCIVASSKCVSKICSSASIQNILNYILISKNNTNYYICLLDLRKQSFWKKDWFNNVISKQYEDVYVTIPEKYDQILTNMYGDYMKVPPENERYTSIMKDIIIEFNESNAI